MRIWNQSLFLKIIQLSGFFYKSPSNFNYWFNFGFLAMFFLIMQILSGIIIAMFYNAFTEITFGLLISTTNEIYYGWWLRYMHSIGASFFFLVVYIHMFKNIYYGSYVYPRQFVWVTGSIIWIIMIGTAFLGYILPWGQMSFWAAVVITNLISAIPLFGNDLVYLLWGGFSIDNSTVHRFYSLHYTLPFIILMLSILHIFLLHEYGSNNPLGIPVVCDNIPFVPYYLIKDIFSIILILFFFFYFVFFLPDYLGHSDNYIEANFLVTPVHIVPEWYFLPLYAILRSVPNKLFGGFLIIMSISCIIFLPFYNKGFIRSGLFRPFYNFFVFIFLFNCILLGWIGGLPVIYPYYEIGQCLTFLYFFILLFIFPVLNLFERIIYLSYINKNN